MKTTLLPSGVRALQPVNLVLSLIFSSKSKYSLFWVFLLSCSFAFATNITGTVKCTDGTLIPNVVVKAYKLDGTFMSQVTTNSSGYFNITPTGGYDGQTVQLRVTYNGQTVNKNVVIVSYNIEFVINCATICSFINISESCVNGLHRICFSVRGTGGASWSASLKKNDIPTDHGIPLISGIGDQDNVCATVSAASFDILKVYSSSHFILWGMINQTGGSWLRSRLFGSIYYLLLPDAFADSQ
jgi:hypothetical protein